VSGTDPGLTRRAGRADRMIGEDGSKRAVTAAIVKVLIHHRDDRGMTLEPYASRCMRRGEVHEIVSTIHTDTTPGSRIDRVAFIGFAEIDRGGVIDRGDRVMIGEVCIGTVLGFDTCHYPNHYNILVCTDEPRSGRDLALEPEVELRFESS
jgi:hypothetical protein